MKLPTLFAFVLFLAISAAAQSVITTIPVGSAPSLVAVDRNTNLIYVTNAGDNTVSVIDGSTNTVIDTVPVASFPQAVAVNSSLHRIYVGNFGSTDQLSIIASGSDTERDIQVSKVQVITGLGVNSTNGSVYMCNSSKKIIVLNGHTNTVNTTIAVPNCGFGLGVNARTNLVYVGTFTPNITVIDSQTNQITNVFSITLTGIVTVAVEPRSNFLGVVDTNAGVFDVLNAATGALIGGLAGLSRPFGAVFEPGGHVALVTEESGNDLALIDTQNFSILSRTPVGNFPLGVDLNPATHLAYVVNTSDNTVSVVALP